MALPATYGFGGSENPLATNWTTATGCSGMKESGGNALNSTATTQNGSYWDADTFDADQYAQCVIRSLSHYGGVILRHGSNNYLTVYIRDSTRVRISRYDSGSFTLLTTLSGSVAADETLRAEIEGANPGQITVSMGDDSWAAYEESSVDDAGPAGITAYGIDTTTGCLDDFEAGNLGGAPSGWPHDLGGTGAATIGGVGGTDKDNIGGVGGVT